MWLRIGWLLRRQQMLVREEVPEEGRAVELSHIILQLYWADVIRHFLMLLLGSVSIPCRRRKFENNTFTRLEDDGVEGEGHSHLSHGRTSPVNSSSFHDVAPRDAAVAMEGQEHSHDTYVDREPNHSDDDDATEEADVELATLSTHA